MPKLSTYVLVEIDVTHDGEIPGTAWQAVPALEVTDSVMLIVHGKVRFAGLAAEALGGQLQAAHTVALVATGDVVGLRRALERGWADRSLLIFTPAA